jgi:hypothetical protein
LVPTPLADPSFIAALVFSGAAAVALLGYARIAVLAARHRRALPEDSAPPWRNSLLLPFAGTLVSTCLLTAYVLRAFGTRNQQVLKFVALSDTLVLLCPICQCFCVHQSAHPSTDRPRCAQWFLRLIASFSTE